MNIFRKRWVLPFALYCWPGLAQAQLQITVNPTHYSAAIEDEGQEQEVISQIPGNASLVDDSQWSDQRETTVKDITDYIPGVIDQPRDGAESDRLSIRGSGLSDTFQGRGLLVMQDGVPINMADGQYEFPVIDPWLTRYVEVFPGANALVFGASNFGGAINFVTPTGATDNGYDFRSEIGSFGTFHSQISNGETWTGGDAFFAASGFLQDGFRQQNEQDTLRFNANVGLQLSDDFSNRIYLSHIHSDAEIPGAITHALSEADPSAANPLNLAENYQRNLDITRIADKSAWVDGNDRIDSTLFYTYRTLDNPVTTYEFQNNNDLGIREKYTHEFGLNQFFAGFNSYYGNANESRFVDDFATPGAPILTRNLYASTSEVYGQYEQNLVDRLYGILGAQDSYDTRNITQLTPTRETQDKTYTGFSPRVGLRYDFDKQTQAFTNLSRSFEPPTFNELSGGNSPGFFDLKAQTATTAELGMRGLNDGIHWQAAYYHGWLRNEFVDYEFANGSTATINAPRTKKDGIELGADGDVANNLWANQDSLSARAAFTFNHFTLDNDPLFGDNILPGVPEYYIRTESLYHHPSGFSFGPNIEWSPRAAPVDLTNTLYTDNYVLLGARAYWESPDQRLNFYIEGRNLLNRNYIATNNVIPNAAGVDGRYFYPGEGRAIYTGVRWKF